MAGAAGTPPQVPTAPVRPSAPPSPRDGRPLPKPVTARLGGPAACAGTRRSFPLRWPGGSAAHDVRTSIKSRWRAKRFPRRANFLSSCSVLYDDERVDAVLVVHLAAGHRRVEHAHRAHLGLRPQLVLVVVVEQVQRSRPQLVGLARAQVGDLT